MKKPKWNGQAPLIGEDIVLFPSVGGKNVVARGYRRGEQGLSREIKYRYTELTQFDFRARLKELVSERFVCLLQYDQHVTVLVWKHGAADPEFVTHLTLPWILNTKLRWKDENTSGETVFVVGGYDIHKTFVGRGFVGARLVPVVSPIRPANPDAPLRFQLNSTGDAIFVSHPKKPRISWKSLRDGKLLRLGVPAELWTADRMGIPERLETTLASVQYVKSVVFRNAASRPLAFATYSYFGRCYLWDDGGICLQVLFLPDLLSQQVRGSPIWEFSDGSWAGWGEDERRLLVFRRNPLPLRELCCAAVARAMRAHPSFASVFRALKDELCEELYVDCVRSAATLSQIIQEEPPREDE
jgi:hypothetical protein